MPVHHARFGTGHLTFLPSGATPTPIMVVALRDIAVTHEIEQEPLEGDSAAAIDLAIKSEKLTLSAKTAEYRADAIAALQGSTLSTGRLASVDGESYLIPTTPFQVTVANVTGFLDLGVKNVNDGIDMVRVAAAPAQGQYSVSAGGQYTFAAADVGDRVLIRYAYTIAGTGKTLDHLNQKPRISTPVRALLFNEQGGKKFGIDIPNLHLGGIPLTLKSRDWSESEFTGIATADPGTTLFKRYFE